MLHHDVTCPTIGAETSAAGSRLLRYPKSLADDRNSLTLAKEKFFIAKLADDLFSCKGSL